MQDIYIHPCEVWFGGGRTRLRTTLGSCVAITLWHPTLHIGGICHFMLSHSPSVRRVDREGCYADTAMELLQAKLCATGQRPEAFEAKLFGAGNMFCRSGLSSKSIPIRIQERNIAAGRELAMQYGHRVVAEHVGGRGHRQLVFDLATGLAWLKHAGGSCADHCECRCAEKAA
ncbi:chemotaxis protein CheD [Thiocystis violascens]|uniref:Probable chemoreceptor glutamine deamidase CheD n=1 Tax=Thiocystis violascens (strain ATCC 17096 / DSM 198 / 6111) TaxID=765911 RepID=I3YG23_THIV6|nr:chemotaxis protein CheD [Thiocystis violascens]AFL75941.1 chemotaxis protein [Thiocystis violascens DSM 198]